MSLITLNSPEASRSAAPPAVLPVAGGGEAGLAPPPFALYPPRSRAGLDARDIGDFSRRIEGFRRRHAATPDHERLGCVQIFDLEQIRLRFGRRWPSLAEKVYSMVEGMLAKRLGPDDLYLAVDDDRIVALVTGLDRRAAETRGRLIAADLTMRLCGTVPGGVAVRVRTLSFDLERGLAGLAGPRGLIERIDSVGKALDEAELVLLADNEEHLRLVFNPIINVKKRLVPGAQACLRVAEPDGGCMPVEALCPASVNGIFDAAVDWETTQRLGELMAHAGRAERRALVILPVHYETLAAMRFRARLMEACRGLPDHLVRRLIIEVVDLPPCLPQSRVRELMAYIRPFCVSLMVRQVPDAIETGHLGNCGVGGLSLDAVMLEGEDPSAAKLMQRLAAAGSEAGLRTLVSNITSLPLSQAALAAGIDYVGGPCLMPSATEPFRPIALGRRR